MSSSEPTRRHALAVLAMAAALPLAGCIRPLYAPPPPGKTGVADRLRAVEVATSDERVGVVLRNELIFGLTGGGEPLPPGYRLDFTLTQRIIPTTVQASSNLPTSETLELSATFTLTDVATDKVAFQGVQTTTASYDRTRQRFQAVRARRDAEDRAAKAMADLIVNRLALHFSQG